MNFFIEPTQNRKLIQQWGNHIDPEVSSQTYLNSEDAATALWAQEYLEQLQELDKDTLNLYRRHMRNCDLRCAEDVLLAQEQPCTAKHGANSASLLLEKVFAHSAADIAQTFENQTLYHAYMRLTARQKTVVYLRFIREQSTSQIARSLSTSERNVRDIAQRALAQLRKAMGVPQKVVSEAAPFPDSQPKSFSQALQNPSAQPWAFALATQPHVERSFTHGITNHVPQPQCHSNTLYEL